MPPGGSSVYHRMSHRESKHDLLADAIALRKQVSDLKEAALARRRVEDALRESERLYRSLVEEGPLGILRLSGTGKVLLVNQVMAERLGYASVQDFHTIGELRGLFESDAECRNVVQSAVSGATVLSAQCRRKDGSLIGVMFRVRRSDSGELTFVVLPSLDDG